jgi:hypothetical protein
MVEMKYSDMVQEKNGNLLVLVTSDTGFTLTRCTATGEPLAVIEIKGMRKAFDRGFRPGAVFSEDGVIFLVDRQTGKIAVIGGDGVLMEGKSCMNCSSNNFRKRTSDALNVFSKLLREQISRVIVKITKPSFSCNGNDPAKSSFSRNGLLIDWVGK